MSLKRISPLLIPLACVIVLLSALCAVLARPGSGPEPAGWFAGDAHVHRGILCGRADANEMLAPEELLEGMKANNLAVVSVLGDIGNGESKYAEKDFPLINGRDHPLSTPHRIFHWDAEWHFDPRGVTFEEKVIGGHLILLGLQEGRKFFAEYTYPVFKWAREQKAIAGFAHMQYLRDDIPQGLDCCLPLEYPVETALGSAAFLMEDVDGGETATRAWYRLLNCGFRPGLAAATDFPCNRLEPFGTLLTYVRIADGKLTYRQWIEGIAAGRTVVSRNGHNEFLDLTVNGAASPGDEVHLGRPGSVKVTLRWSSVREFTGKVELVRNGQVAAHWDGSVSPDSPLTLRTELDFARSGWLAARRMDEAGHRLHTGAIFVTVGRSPIRASAADADYFVRFIDNLIQKTSPGGSWNEYFKHDLAAAQVRYRRARAVFRRIALDAQAEASRGDTSARPTGH